MSRAYFDNGKQREKMKKMKSARMMLAVSMAIFGTLGLFVRNISVSSGKLALYRAVLAAV